MSKTIARPGVGMTPEEAQELIDSGYAWIRHQSKSDKEHWGGGMLLAVEGKYGIIRPALRHRQNEKVPLSDMKPWKSKNTACAQRDGIILDDDEEPTMKYVVLDTELALVWAGSQKGFLEDISHAITYETKTEANRGIGGMKRSNRWSEIAHSKRIKIYHFEEAEAILEDAHDNLYKEKPVVTDEAPVKKAVETEDDELMAAMQELEEALALVAEAKARCDRAIQARTPTSEKAGG
jgi:hypothetical protein